VKECRFGLFCWDCAVGAFLVSLVYAYTMGSSGHAHRSFFVNVHVADASNIGWALLPGVIFNFANLLRVAGIYVAGLAVSVGIAMVAGVFF